MTAGQTRRGSIALPSFNSIASRGGYSGLYCTQRLQGRSLLSPLPFFPSFLYLRTKANYHRSTTSTTMAALLADALLHSARTARDFLAPAIASDSVPTAPPTVLLAQELQARIEAARDEALE